MITNVQFLQAIFGDSYIYSHVTSFTQDPFKIPSNERNRCWAGGYYKDTPLIDNSNQFYTVSLFSPDEAGKSRRRKVNFAGTYVIGLDDVKEKLPLDQVNRLPKPSIILKSSLYSEQWLYILSKPEHDRNRIDNLHDGLIKNGLAPDSKDPGQKGVTRYLRLPEGYNTKGSRVAENGGTAPKCEVTEFQPDRRYTLEQLAEPFNVDLNFVRRESRVDGAAEVADHPLLDLADIIRVKEVRSDGRFDITCPWVEGHTGADDSGTAVFTNADGTIGFKCHHGSCQDRTGNDLLNLIEEQYTGFRQKLSAFQTMRILADVQTHVTPAPVQLPEVSISFMGVNEEKPAMEQLHDMLRREIPDSNEAMSIASKFLQLVDGLSAMEQVSWHGKIRDTMRWSKVEFNSILKELRETWYTQSKAEVNFFDEVIFIAEANQFYNCKKRIFYTPEAYQNAYSHLDPEARKEALTSGRVMKVDKLDYAPKMPAVFTEGGVTYGNSWSDSSEVQGESGAAEFWLDHFNVIGWGEHRKHLLQWMAFTIQHPDKKINHMITLGSSEGCGKDFLLYPLTKALGDNSTTISGDELLENFNDFLLGTKFLLVNETELGDHKDAQTLNARLKPLTAAPPERLRVNQKGVKKVEVRNILSVAMTTNSLLPFRLSGQSRRIFAIWSGLNTRDASGQMTKGWLAYWQHRWDWMKAGGFKQCIHYLRNSVDLSDFNPGAPPIVTGFLRDIQESSKPAQQQTIEAFIDNRVGQFNCDLISVKDATAVLRSGDVFSSELMYARADWFTPTKVGTGLNAINAVQKMVAYDGSRQQVLYCIRNYVKYTHMSKSELWKEYEKQKKGVPNSLTVVR